MLPLALVLVLAVSSGSSSPLVLLDIRYELGGLYDDDEDDRFKLPERKCDRVE